MSDLHPLSFLAIPPDVLVALDYRPFRFALQPVHHLIRLVHILSISAFFGGVGLLDLRLLGVRSTVQMKAFSDLVLPWLYVTFAVGIVTGLLLFFYDPVHAGSHSYFTLKLILIVLGVANAMVFNSRGFWPTVAAARAATTQARVVGTVSFVIWLGVMICAGLNTEAAPKLLLMR